MIDDFDRASARTHALAQQLQAEGFDLGFVADALMAEALAAFAAHHRKPEMARALASTWAKLRRAADGD